MADVMTSEQRIARLEARVERLEKALEVARAEPATVSAAAIAHSTNTRRAQEDVVKELWQRELREMLRNDEKLLERLRQRRARENTFLAERGLPPIPFEWDDL